jgi:hypothetical protein
LLPCIYPKWRPRYLVLIGNYLFRFESEHDEKPKGVPIPIDSVSVKVMEDGHFELSTLRKYYYLRADSVQEAEQWANAIKTRKFLAIKENMGHSPLQPEIKAINDVGNRLFDGKLKADKAELNASFNPMNAGLL